MNQNVKSNIVLVLDLDDTLYTEADYVISGIKYIADLLEKITKISIKDDLISFYKGHPGSDFLEFACNATRLPLSAKETLLWSYRLHSPTISLDKETHDWLKKSQHEYHALAILTDGRSITQRLKIDALGIIDIPAYISEEWDSLKPDKKRFLAIQDRWKNKNYIYIGDNPKKDFAAPNALHWISVGLKNNGRNIHTQEIKNNAESPKYWIRKFSDINSIVKLIK